VGGQAVGSISFTVSAKTAIVSTAYSTRSANGTTTAMQSASPDGAPGGPSAPPGSPTPVQTQTPPPTNGTAPAAGFSLASIPLWGWGAGLVAILLIMRPGGKR
jgi:hypothetical protein